MSRFDHLARSLPTLSARARKVMGALYERQPQSPTLLQHATGLAEADVRWALAELHGTGVLRGGLRLRPGEPGYVWIDFPAAVAPIGSRPAPSSGGHANQRDNLATTLLPSSEAPHDILEVNA